MSLTYRGVTYDATQSSVAVSEEVIGRYRGAAATRHLPKVANVHPIQGLKYRGATVR